MRVFKNSMARGGGILMFLQNVGWLYVIAQRGNGPGRSNQTWPRYFFKTPSHAMRSEAKMEFYCRDQEEQSW